MILTDLYMPQAKRCILCDALKDHSEFGTDKYRPDGKSDRCKECRRAKGAKGYHDNPESGRARTAKWRAEHPDKVREYEDTHKPQKKARGEKRRAEKSEEIRAYQKERYLKDKDRLRPIRAKWEAEHREERLAKKAAAHLANPEKRRARGRRAYAKNPGYFLAKHKQYVAQKHNAQENDFSDAQWQETQALQKHCCYYCGTRCKGQLTQDHIQPLSKSGNHSFRNVIAVCLRCNSRKGNRPAPVAVQIPLLVVAPPAKPRGPRPRKQTKTDPQQTLALQEKEANHG
jgi:5-methylcytosine-specific restriction endonuclease McrA